jgi:hypothetical protein
LELFSVGQQSRIYSGRSNRCPDLPHAFADGVKEGPARILHQMPAVGDLNGVREGSLGGHGITAAAISSDNADLRLAGQPSLRRRWFSIGQKRDRFATLEVAQKGPIAMVSPPGPVINANYCRRREFRGAATAHNTQQRVVAHADIEPPRQCRCRPPAQRDRKAMNDVVKAGRASGVSSHSSFKALGKDAPPTVLLVAKIPTRPQYYFRAPACKGKVDHSAQVAVVNTTRH